MAEIPAVQVNLWGQFMGAVAPLRNKPGLYEFSYAPAFEKGGLEVSPLRMRLNSQRRFSFTDLSQETFYGLPGLLADALPDQFGKALVDEQLSRRGLRPSEVTPLHRLVHAGRCSWGALEFESAETPNRQDVAPSALELARLLEDVRHARKGEFFAIAQDLIDIGSTVSGARAKAVIGWNPQTKAIVSGQFDVPEGFEHWLLIFDVGRDGEPGATTGSGQIEYAHFCMAEAAGIEMSPYRLWAEDGRMHFMTKRCDREGNYKLHTQTLSALMHLDAPTALHGYDQYLRAVLSLNLGADALEQAWARCVFNVAVGNCADPTKNLSFLMDPTGQWKLAPAYGNGFSFNPDDQKCARLHQRHVTEIKEDITSEVLLDLAKAYDLRRSREKLQQILDAVARWPEFAKNAGVPAAEIRRISLRHLILQREPRPRVMRDLHLQLELFD